MADETDIVDRLPITTAMETARLDLEAWQKWSAEFNGSRREWRTYARVYEALLHEITRLRAQAPVWRMDMENAKGEVLRYEPVQHNRHGQVSNAARVVLSAGHYTRKTTHWMPAPPPPTPEGDSLRTDGDRGE